MGYIHFKIKIEFNCYVVINDMRLLANHREASYTTAEKEEGKVRSLCYSLSGDHFEVTFKNVKYSNVN